MAMADLAAQGEGACVSLAAIGARQSISVSYLEQLFAMLRRAGLVKSQRGAKGGYALSTAPHAITLDKIIAAVNEDIRAHGCTPANKQSCTGQGERCLTHNLWGALESHIGAFLSAVTIQDVIEERFSIAPDVAPIDMEVVL